MDPSDGTLASGHTFKAISGEEYERQTRDFNAYKPGMIRLSPGGWYLPIKYSKYANTLFNFEFRPSDVVVMTYPKMGTTWTQEIVWTMKNNPDLNHPMAHLPTMARSPFLDADMIFDNDSMPMGDDFFLIKAFKQTCPGKDPADGISIMLAQSIPDPRTIKVHLPFSLFKKSLIDTCKIIYVARNPKDGLMSFYHHSRLLKHHDYVGSFDQFVKYFVDDELMYSPYWEHIREAWKVRDHPNVLFLFYEDMKEDIEREIRKINQFLGTKLTDTQIQNVIKVTSFETMKNDQPELSAMPSSESFMNSDVLSKDGGFFRKGQTGSWKNKLSPEQEAKIDEWTKKNSSELGLTFKYV